METSEEQLRVHSELEAAAARKLTVRNCSATLKPDQRMRTDSITTHPGYIADGAKRSSAVVLRGLLVHGPVSCLLGFTGSYTCVEGHRCNMVCPRNVFGEVRQ